MPRRRRNRTLTEAQNAIGRAGTGEQQVAVRLQAGEFGGALSPSEKKFVKGTASQDPERVRQVIRNTRKANEGFGSRSTVSGPRKSFLQKLGF